MLLMNTYNSAEFATLAGVSVKTLQRWDREGRLTPAARTPGNRRLYTPGQLNTLLNRLPQRERVAVAYLRVSSQAQKPDVANQRAALEKFCIAKGIAIDEWISEIGGGLNFKRPQFPPWWIESFVERVPRWSLRIKTAWRGLAMLAGPPPQDA